MASQPRPTDEVLIEAARAHVLRLCGPGKAPRAVIIPVEGVPDPITIPVLPGAAPPPPPFVANEFQESILAALSGKALRTDALAAKVGERRRLFKPGGIKELVAAGLVGHRDGLGYYSTEDPPEGLEGG